MLADGTGAFCNGATGGGIDQVFNFEVEDFHTYYVGQQGVWVHNTNCAAASVAPERIVYYRTDITGKIALYGGQAMNNARYLARQAEHAPAFPDAEFKFSIIDRANPGSALDIAEHNFIQELTRGVAARRSSAVSNLRDPVGAARRTTFGLPEPR